MKRLIVAALAACLAASVCSKTLGYVRTENEALVLTDVKDVCPDGMTVGVWGGKGQEPVLGCWFEAHGFVWIAFADGDTKGIPKRVFHWEES